MTSLLQIDETEGHPVGRDPREMTADELAGAGIERTPILAAVRAKCLDCSGGAPSEVRRCTATGCALWPFRMNHNPFRSAREMSDEQRAAAADRLRAARSRVGQPS